MFNSFINNIPLVKEVLNVILNQSLGFNIDLDQITIDKGIKLSFNNIDLQSNKLNQILFNGENNAIRLRITKISLKSFSLCLSANEYCINVNGLHIVIMPISHYNHNQTESIPSESSVKSIKPINDSQKNSQVQQNGVIDSLLRYILSRIEVKIEDIAVHILNYETTKENILLANPCLSIKIGMANYTKGVCNVEKESRTVIGNKMLSIENVNVMIEKNYRENLNTELMSSIGRDNAVIFTLENSKGIKAYSNYNNDISIELGITQVIINPLQIELLRNIILTYIDLLKTNSESSPSSIEHKSIKEEDDFIKETQNDFELLDIDQSTIKFKCEGISFILLENNYRSDIPKYYLFEANHERLSNHFCYFEDNFYLLSLCDINASKQHNKLKASIDSLQLIFIEYDSKSNESLEMVKVNDDVYSSVYEDAKTSIENSKDNDCYHSVDESGNIYLEKQIKNYTFKYKTYVMIAINNLKMQMDNNNPENDDSSLTVSIYSLNIIIHPIYMFKFLKGLYSNAILLNEILLFNCNQNSNELVNDHKEMDLMNINDEINSKTDRRVKQNNDIRSNNNHINTNNSIAIDTDQSTTQSIKLKLNISEIEISVQAFKREKDFETIATPYFAEFYYDSIYLMNMKYNCKKCLNISLITLANILSFQMKNIQLDLNSNQLNLQIGSFNSFFDKKSLIHSSNPLNISYSNAIINSNETINFNTESQNQIKSNPTALIVKINTSLTCTLSVWQLKNVITFIEVWSVTLSIYNIFKKQMQVNHYKLRRDIDSKYTVKPNHIQKKQISIRNDDTPIFISLTLSTMSLNIKTYYDTDSLITSFDDFQMKLLLSNTANIDFYISLKEIRSRKLFSADHISFYFNLKQSKPETKCIKNQTLIKEQEIQPEQDFEYFIIRSKLLLKQNNRVPNNQRIFFTITTNNINFQPLNILSLFVAVLPQIQNNDSLLKNNTNNQYNTDDLNDSAINNLTSSNLLSNFSENNSTVIDFEIKIDNIEFDYTKSQTSLILSLKEIHLSPASAYLNEFKLDISREISSNSKQTLMTTLASICDVKFAKTEIGDIDLGLGRIDIKFCKDSLWCLIESITELSTQILSKIKEITEFISSNDDNETSSTNKPNISMLNNSLISLNSNFIQPIIQLNIEDAYSTKVQSSKYFESQPDNDYMTKNKDAKKTIKIKLTLGDVFVALFQGKDFESQIDYNATQVDVICSEGRDDEFVLVQSNQFAIKSKRDINDYLMLSMHHLEFKSDIELDTINSASISLVLANIEVFDNLSSSNFKRMISRKDIESIGSMVNVSIILNNSFNSLSVSHYCDYEIIADCSILPLRVCIDQTTLSFILSFFTIKEDINMSMLITNSKSSQGKDEKEEEEEEEQLEDKESFTIQPPPQEIKKPFVHLSHHCKMNKENHIFIRKFNLDEIAIDISFNYLTFSTSSNNITIPILGVEQFPFLINEIKLKGYYLPSDLASILCDNLFRQLMNSKFQILYQGIRSFNLTKPLTNFVEKFVQLFTTPYYSYKDNKGILKGLVKGVRNFIMNIVSLNFLYGEKTVKTLTAFIGVSKSNQITKQSFYNKYILDEQQQKVNEYFYKG